MGQACRVFFHGVFSTNVSGSVRPLFDPSNAGKERPDRRATQAGIMAILWDGLRRSLIRWGADAGKAIDQAVNEDCIRLAVTGLSRAGKTVFITSLIQNL